MKNLFLLICFCINLICSAQIIEKFYDHNWKICDPSGARFYSILKKTDSGWYANDYYLATNRLQMSGLYTDSSSIFKNGLFKYYHPNGYLKSSGFFKQNKKEGLWISLHPNGYMSDSTFYEDGKPKGISLSWSIDGSLTDSLFVGEDGKAVKVEWFSNGNIAAAGRLDERGRKYGRWQFYYKDGGISSSEIYEKDSVKQFTFFTKDGKPIENANFEIIPASFPGGNEAWQKHLLKKLYFPNYILKNTTSVSVVVEFEIDEEGKVQNAEVTVPLHPEFDRIALDAIKKSPNWSPAKMHNRNVVYRNRQLVNFNQVEY
jgi:TonB family protein